MSLLFEDVGIVKQTVSSYLWEVKNFSISGKNTGDCLSSPVFSTMQSRVEHNWRIRLFPKDDKYRKVIKHKFQKPYQTEFLLHGFSKYEKQDYVADKTNRVVVDDTIRILCEIIYDSNLAEPLEKKFEGDALPHCCRDKEFDEFEKLLEAEHTTDVIIRIGKDEIKVHKAILMGRSPVFQAMFEHNMKEKEQNVVEINDIKYEVMKEVVRFIYAGKVNKVETMAVDLLVAADKYSIKGLKVLSAKQLFKELAVTNAIEYLKLANMYNAANLKSEIITYIVRNQEDVVNKPELKELPGELVCEVLCAVVGGNSNK